jgi:hypothetical protein
LLLTALLSCTGPLPIDLKAGHADSGADHSRSEDATLDETGPDGSADLSEAASDTMPVEPIPELPATPIVLAHVDGINGVLPFPWNWFSKADSASVTGLRLDLTGPWRKSVIIQGTLYMFSTWIADAARVDGFGANSLMVIPLSHAPDVEALPNETLPGGPVEVLAVDGPEPGLSEPCSLAFGKYENEGKLMAQVLELQPKHVLKERTRYLLIVRRSLATPEGTSFGLSPLSEVVLGLRAPYGPSALRELAAGLRDSTLEALSALPSPPPLEELAAAYLVTVGTISADMAKAAENLAAQEVEYDLDPDGDGVENIVPPDQYPPFGSSPHPSVAAVVTGRFLCPMFAEEDGYFGLDAGGDVPVQGNSWRDFFLLIPAQPEAWPFHLSTMQHGINSYKETMLTESVALTKLGIAAGGFDFLHHTKGDEAAAYKFIKLDKPNETVSNFRQSGLDLLTFLAAMERLAGERDLSPLGEAGESDLDFSRVALAGHSLGAMESTIAGPFLATDRVGGLITSGGNFRFLFEVFLKSKGLWDIIPGDVAIGFKVLASHLMSRADPATFSRLLMAAPLPGKGQCPFLLLVGLHDETIPPECGYSMTLASGAPLIEPIEEPWLWVPTVPAGQTSFGTIQFVAGHELFGGSDGPEIQQRAQAVFYHYLDTFLKTGQHEILWPQP